MTTGPLLLACLLAAPAADVDKYLPERGFSIPVNIEQSRRAEIQRLELHVSTDEGHTWLPAGNITPDAGKFEFTAPADGLYLFNVGMVDQSNHRQPAAPDVPGAQILRIYVDTVPPRVGQFSAARQGEDVVAQWSPVEEQFPNPAKSRLEYRTPDMPSNAWNPAPVAINPLAGQASFRLNNAYALQVRLHVEDMAGNAAESNPVDVPGSMPPQNVAGGPAPTPGPPGPAPSPAPPGPAPSPFRDPGWQVSGPTAQPQPPQTFQASGGGSVSLAQGGPPGAVPTRPVIGMTGVRGGANVLQTVSNSSPAAPPQARPAGAPALPPLTYTNSMQVMVEYRVGQVGHSGISEVQVYLTEDDGQHWVDWPQARAVGQPTEVDPSKGKELLRHTLQVDLPHEGVFGLYLVVKSGVGKCKPPPQSGVTPPQIRFAVDLQPPEAKLYAPEIVPDKKDAVLLIWEAHDQNLTDTPIALEWAESPNGPWEGIGPPELPNTAGRYTWQVPSRVPPQVYLRLRVRDRAGNVGVAQSERPVDIDLNTPSVDEVQPVPASRQGGTGPQVTPGPPQADQGGAGVTPATFRPVQRP